MRRLVFSPDKTPGKRERGAINGATCLIAAGDPRSATVVTTRDTLVMNISYEDFDSVMQVRPTLFTQFTQFTPQPPPTPHAGGAAGRG